MSSSSKTSQSTAQSDNRVVLGEGAINAAGGSAVNVWNYDLDGQVAGDAMRTVADVASDALGLGSSYLDFGKAAMVNASNTMSDAFGFAEGASTRANTLVSNTVSDAFGFAEGASTRANTLVSNTVSDALGFGSEALSFGRSSMSSVLDAYADASGGALGFADAQAARTGALLGNTFSDSLGFADAQAARSATAMGNAFGDALGFLESAADRFGTMTNRVLDESANTSALVKDAYADAKGRGALTDKMIMGAIAAMALVAFMAVKR